MANERAAEKLQEKLSLRKDKHRTYVHLEKIMVEPNQDILKHIFEGNSKTRR